MHASRTSCDAYACFDNELLGQHIVLSKGDTEARRRASFCDGVVVSKNFIKPGRLVAAEVLETQRGWSGDLRIGFTLLPNDVLTPLPSFLLPNLHELGRSWVIPVGHVAALVMTDRARWRCKQRLHRPIGVADLLYQPVQNGTVRKQDEEVGAQPSGRKSLRDRSHGSCLCCLHTPFGRVTLSQLMPSSCMSFPRLDAERGSTIAFYYTLEPLDPNHDSQPSSSTSVDVQLEGPAPLNFYLHVNLVVNGVDLPKITEAVSFRPEDLYHLEETQSTVYGDGAGAVVAEATAPLASSGAVGTSSDVTQEIQASTLDFNPHMRAVFDVYGQTKAIRLIKLDQFPVTLLSRLCSCTILNTLFKCCPVTDHFVNGRHPESPRIIYFSPLTAEHALAEELRGRIDQLPLPHSTRLALKRDATALAANYNG